MKKIVLNFFCVFILTFTFLNSRASDHSAGDSSSPRPVNLSQVKYQTGTSISSSAPAKDNSGNDLKKFIFSLTLTPWFKTTIPPLNLYFEHGIAGLATTGVSFGAVYDSQSDYDYHSATISFGVRGCGYAFPIISRISGNDINSFGFQPYLGLVYDYHVTAVSIADNDIDPYHSSEFGIVAGTRWYPGKGKFGLLGEFNSNGIGSNVRFGISLGR